MPDSAAASTFGSRLRRYRLLAGLTQATLGERAGIAERTIQDLERGATRPRRRTFHALVAALVLPPDARSELEAVTPKFHVRVPGARKPVSVAHPDDLEVQPTTLLGRKREVAEIRALLEGDARLVTLTGPGGVGKTRLSVEVAAGLLDEFADGVFLIELAPIVDPALLPSSIAQVLAVRDLGGRTLLESLTAFLRKRRLLLLLDNFEQIVTAAPVVAELLATSPGLKVLVTSREPLRLRGEQEYAVPPLALPGAGALPPTDLLSEYAGVALFVQRAAAIRADFGLTEENASAVAEICTRLDGLPLAIELAAARMRVLTLREILDRLDRRLPLLTGGTRDAPARQQTLRNTIAWSHDLLDEGERRLFRRLGVFVGGWTLEAARAVCEPGGPEDDILDGLESLVSKNLVRPGEDGGGETRFTMLETIREFAVDQLDESGEPTLVRRRHAEYFQAVAERAEPALRGPEQGTWLDRLEAEHDNLRAALQLVVESGEAELSLRLSGALSHFWEVRGHHTEGRARLTAVLELAGARAHPRLWAKALCELAFLVSDQGDYVEAHALHETSLAMMRELGEQLDVARSLTGLAWIAIDQGDYAAARALHTESLAVGREVGDRRGIALGLAGLGRIAVIQEDRTAARSFHEESLTIVRELGDARNISRSLLHLGWVAINQQDPDGARERLAEGLAIAAELGDARTVIDGLELSAHIAVALGRMDSAARLRGTAEARREASGTPSSPTERAEDDIDIAAIRAVLGELELAVAWAEGRAMSMDQAVAYAMRLDSKVSAMPTIVDEVSEATSAPLPLTPREAEVAVLVARGLTTRQIAAELVISERTASSHLYRIFGKLGFTSRARLAAWAVTHGLAVSPSTDGTRSESRYDGVCRR